MNIQRLTILGFLLSLAPLTATAANPVGVVVGWDASDGRVLLNELNCTACHSAGEASAWLLPKSSPVLTGVGSRVTPQYLRRYLSDPQAVKPGTPMPHLLHGLDDGEKNAAVEELTHYLVSLGGPIDQRSSGASQSQIKQGETLYHTVGCVACHEPIIAPPEHDRDLPKGIEPEDLALLNLPGTAPAKPSIPLGELSSKTTVEELAKFLQDPLHTRPAGRMPFLNLEAGEARALAVYLLREQYDDSQRSVGSGLDYAVFHGHWNQVPDWDSLTPKAKGSTKGFDLASLGSVDGQSLKNNGGGPPENFGVQFRGLIEVAVDGEHRFWTKSDDGSTLRIDGQLVVDNDAIHAPQEKEGRIQLAKGRHGIEVGFFEVGGGHELTVHWQPPGKKRGPIPADVLFHDAAAMIPVGIAEGEKFRVDEQLAQRGRQRFTALGCAACHQTGERRAEPEPIAPPLATLDGNSPTGCLGENIVAKLPKFAFNPAQRSAVRDALSTLVRKNSAAPSAVEKVDFAMSAMNCYRCHERDDKGGPDLARSHFFVYHKHVDLGDEGRLPPPLDHVGVKLTEVGFDEMLLNGQKYRTYMAARMPQFGRDNVAWMTAAFPQADAGEVPAHEPKFSKALVDVGRQLAGKKGLACINCHAWGDLRLPGAEGLDLLNVTRRIQPGYFHAFLLNPQKLKPRTRMPTGWPNGKSSYPELLDGQTAAQIDALWAYLSVGSKGGLPFGLSPDDATMLLPQSEPITFRTFLDGVGAHCVLVGFPQQTNVAFDANRVRTVVAWAGELVSTRYAWEGRGGEYAKIPTLNQLWLPDGPPFAILSSLEDSWPADIPKAKFGSDRTPTGWQFRGYRFDKARMPTFLYTLPGGLEVAEAPETSLRQDGSTLLRRFRLTSPEDRTNLYLLVARGKQIESTGGLYVKDGKERYTITAAAEPLVRPIGGQQELLLPIPFTASNGKYVAEFTVEMVW